MTIHREKGEGSHAKDRDNTSFLLILMGTIDCVTTVIGVMFSRSFRVEPVNGRHS